LGLPSQCSAQLQIAQDQTAITTRAGQGKIGTRRAGSWVIGGFMEVAEYLPNGEKK
jgi:hypothetical protein